MSRKSSNKWDSEVEKAVLGALFKQPDLLNQILDVAPDDFNDPRCRTIYEAMLKLGPDNIDLVAVGRALHAQGRLMDGGAVFLSNLVDAVPTPAHFNHHADLLRRSAMRKRLGLHFQEALDLVLDPATTIQELLEKLEGAAADVYRRLPVERNVHLKRAAAEALKEIEEASKRGAAMGISTGFPTLDEMTGGLFPGELTVLAARPGMGKSAMATQIAAWIARKGVGPVLFFSLEMNRNQIVNRLISQETGVPVSDLRRRLADDAWPKVVAAVNKLVETNMIINDYDLNIRAITSAVELVAAREGKIGAIVVDYLQLAGSSSRNDSEYERLSQNAKSLRETAKKHKAPLLVLSQLNRKVEERTPPRPRLPDLRGSGTLEEDADVVIFLYRPEYYDAYRDNQQYWGYAEAIFAKQRNGPTGIRVLNFTASCAKFSESGGGLF